MVYRHGCSIAVGYEVFSDARTSTWWHELLCSDPGGQPGMSSDRITSMKAVP